MTHEAIMEKLNEIFQDIFDDDTLVITENTTANDIEDWDSLEHINLVSAVEKAFGMKFRMKWQTLLLPVPKNRSRKSGACSGGKRFSLPEKQKLETK